MKIQKIALLSIFLILSVLLTACSSSGETNAESDKKTIKIGATSGPYSDQVTEGIKPFLEEKGYKVEIIEFNDYIQPNISLEEGDIDANVFQNEIYLKTFAESRGLDITELIKVPTAPIGIYSKEHKSIDKVEDGATIATSNEPVNQARALAMLEELGWVKLKERTDPTKASEKDISEYIKKIVIQPIEPAQIPRALDSVDYSFINGNFAISSGMKLTEAIVLEKTPKHYLNVVAVRGKDKDSQLAKDLFEAYQSKEFKKLNEESEKYQGYVWPEWMK
ncbi:MetQ/NlpA family ABC transporter substrate-binding protein [Paenisporosarcina sp. OV554]|uniref:MetQ/NlpA family ABC transporter substrate-binding protein n=1 Tax=Paenisporosarcina sp. OV554 TaxID=2135694 RepID=UPI000D3A78D5|nr:MetQ/NlpA family ABC transporter substrate-binding protein [Paenisporosarcina sp. OV554]PUB14011.1 D-methionine transport system substrate-binding protein [Paenisporosarcina sp. OV554]